MFKSIGNTGSPPLAPTSTPIVHTVDISHIIDKLYYIRVIGSGTSDTWGGVLNLTFSISGGIEVERFYAPLEAHRAGQINWTIKN